MSHRVHRKYQEREAGDIGELESKLASGERLDVLRRKKAIEIERGSNINGASRRLKQAEREGRATRVELLVPHPYLSEAEKAMRRRRFRIPAKVSNLSRTRVIKIV